MKKLLLVLLCFPIIGFGQSWQYSEEKTKFNFKKSFDLKKNIVNEGYNDIKGVWIGYNKLEDDADTYKFMFSDDRALLYAKFPDKEQEQMLAGKYIVNSKKKPNYIDIKVEKLNSKHTMLLLGIYKIENNKLIISFNNPNESRPKYFLTSRKEGATFIFEKVKQ